MLFLGAVGFPATGIRARKRAPPEADSVASTVPPWEAGDGADDRQAEPGAGPAGGVGGTFAADQAIQDLGPHRDRDTRPVVGDFDHRVVALPGEP